MLKKPNLFTKWGLPTLWLPQTNAVGDLIHSTGGNLTYGLGGFLRYCLSNHSTTMCANCIGSYEPLHVQIAFGPFVVLTHQLIGGYFQWVNTTFPSRTIILDQYLDPYNPYPCFYVWDMNTITSEEGYTNLGMSLSLVYSATYIWSHVVFDQGPIGNEVVYQLTGLTSPYDCYANRTLPHVSHNNVVSYPASISMTMP